MSNPPTFPVGTIIAINDLEFKVTIVNHPGTVHEFMYGRVVTGPNTCWMKSYYVRSLTKVGNGYKTISI